MNSKYEVGRLERIGKKYEWIALWEILGCWPIIIIWRILGIREKI